MTNYQRGYEIERKIVNEQRKSGNVAFRSAGSHSPIDVAYVDKFGVHLLQVKRVKKYHHGMFKKEIKELEAIKCPTNCFRELRVWEDNYGWVLTKII
jgi:Holliday junction resolvase